MRSLVQFLSIGLAFLGLSSQAAAVEITPTIDETVLANGVLVNGLGVQLISAAYSGADGAAGTFKEGPLGLANGTVLSSGKAADSAQGVPGSGGTKWALPGDSLCAGMIGGEVTKDAARLDIILRVGEGFDGIHLNYIVGSNEYPEYVGSINDVAAIFVDGQNKALDLEGKPITLNGPFFGGNTVITSTETALSGSTPRLAQAIKLSPGVHTIVMVVCDAGDDWNDTAIFVGGLRGCKGECTATSWCGDGTKDGDEDCDDGNNVVGDGCDNSCLSGLYCGNSKCQGDETCETCPYDCGECRPSTCGNAACDGTESCRNCPDDCGLCPEGYGTCKPCCENALAQAKVGGGAAGCSSAPTGSSSGAATVLLLLPLLAFLGFRILRARKLRLNAALLSLAFLALLGTKAQALEIQPSNDATALAHKMVVGAGIQITGATFVGADTAAGTFAAGPLGLSEGIILTSGAALGALPPNNNGEEETIWNLAGDPLCTELAGTVTHDAARLEITFSVAAGYDGIRLSYLVGSEEYPVYVGEINDVAGVFVDGVNIALDAEGHAITINGPFFSGSTVVTDTETEYNGSTPRLAQEVHLGTGSHTMVIVVCDAMDARLDTGIFVGAMGVCKGECQGTSWCGDGARDPGEDCDDGNNVEEDGCGNNCTLTAACGDSECFVSETCLSCPADCGACPPEPTCDDGQCNGEENCNTCPADCGECPPVGCGDGSCGLGESCEICAVDCGECPAPVCGDGTCNGEETCEDCVADCGECPAPSCGDGTCNGLENCELCPGDCGACPAPVCGDGFCKGGETCLTCSADCGACPPKCEACETTACTSSEAVVQGGCSIEPKRTSSSGAGLLLLLFALALIGLGVRRGFFRGGQGMLLVAVVAGATMTPAIALAQQKVQIETQLFKPSPFVGDYFTVGTGDAMGECRWNIGLMLNYQNDPLVLATDSGDHLGSLVGHQTTANVLGAIKLVDWLALGFDVPVVVHQVGDRITGFPTAGSGGMGDIRLVPRARLYKSAGGLFSLAAEAGVSFPTGKQFDAYMGRNGYSIFPRLLGSFDFGWSGLALNAGALVVSREDRALNVATGNAIDTRLGAWVGVVPKEVDLIGEVNSQMKLGEPLANAEETPLELIGGMRWKAIPGLFVTGGAGAGITAGAGGPDFRAFVGVQYASCCQKKAAPPPPPPPPPPKPVCDPDPDGDRLCSSCVSEQKREAEFASVCKAADKCPAEAEDVDGNEDSDGCPDPDNEPDGICDPWVEEQGLAETYKGICVGADKCPDQPETLNSYQDEDGCQDQAVLIEEKKIIILQTVEFHFNEARIKEESFPLLDEVVKTLKDNPQIQKIRIEGHTDERGEAGYNQKLSAGRVQTVLNYLVEHGVDAKRLTSKGFGEARPLVKGATTEEDHQKNRRVEFIILEAK